MAGVRYLLSIVVLAAALVGLVPAGPGLLVGAVLGALGALASVRDARRLAERRERADVVLADGPGLRVPDGVRWRADELRDPRERRLLSRALWGVLRDVEAPPTLMLLPANRRAVRANRAVIVELAARLAAVEQPVDPGAVARVRLLLVRSGSPLYDPAGGDALGRELAVALRSIEPRR